MPTHIINQPKRRRRLNVQNIMLLILLATFILWLYASLFLKNRNVNLNVSIQSLKQEVASLQNENESLKIDIRELASYENVSRIANESNLQVSQVNVYSLADGH